MDEKSKCKTINYYQNTRELFQDTGMGNNFLDRTLKAQKTKVNINKINYKKSKTFSKGNKKR